MAEFAICRCDGQYDGCAHTYPCGQDVLDNRWGPWCSECNPRRFARIDRRMSDIQSEFGTLTDHLGKGNA